MTIVKGFYVRSRSIHDMNMIHISSFIWYLNFYTHTVIKATLCQILDV